MKRLSVRIALIFTAICLGVITAAAVLLFITYRGAIVTSEYEDVKVVYAETARLIREMQAGLIGMDDVESGVDAVSRVGLSKIYVLDYDPASLDAALPDVPGIHTATLSADLLLISRGSTVFRERVFREGNDAPYIFYGGPSPASTAADTSAILVFTSAGPMYSQVARAAHFIGFGAIFVILITAIAIFYSADRLFRPLRLMSTRARLLAQGEAIDDIPSGSDDEIGDLTRSFNHLKTRVLENENARQEFLSSISHDIRTPLTHIHASALGLKEGWIPPDMREKAVAIIADESERLVRMAGDLLEAIRLQSGVSELRLAVVDMHALMHTAAETSAHPDQVTVECPEDLHTSLDESLFQRVLANLLDNAFRYGQGIIEMRLGRSETGFRLTVRDHGDGLPEAELERIFERFYRSGATSGKPHGMGIGLHSARRAMQMHGGRIFAQNAEGGGLEIVMEWPDTLHSE